MKSEGLKSSRVSLAGIAGPVNLFAQVFTTEAEPKLLPDEQ